MARAQAAFEFSFMVALAMILMMLLLVIIVRLSLDHSEEERREAILALGRSIQDELILAATVHPGYSHEFTLPERAGRFTYNVTSKARAVEIASDRTVITFPAPAYTGTLAIGPNTIRNVDGEVIIA